VVVERRLRVAAEHLVARGAPQPPGALGIALRPDLGVQLGDPPPPVPEVKPVLKKIVCAGRGFGAHGSSGR
jgi:hypothetical protein